MDRQSERGREREREREKKRERDREGRQEGRGRTARLIEKCKQLVRFNLLWCCMRDQLYRNGQEAVMFRGNLPQSLGSC